MYACDPLSDLEKQLDQSENLWQLGNMLQSKNNLHQLHVNYKAAKQKHVNQQQKAMMCFPPSGLEHERDLVRSCTAGGATGTQSSW